MGDWTIENLKEIEDSAPRFGLAPALEARFAREPLECAQGGVSYFSYAPNARAPFGHLHKQQEEVYVLVSGSGRVKIEDAVRDLRQWDAVRIGPDTMRAFEAGPEGMEIVVFGAPQTGPGEAEIVPDWWSG